MLYKILVFILILFSFSCPIKAQESTDTTSNNYDKILTQREKDAAAKKTDSLGTLVTEISFKVKTDNLTDFEDGFIHWVELENPEKDLKQLTDKDEVVITANKVIVIIDYPLTKECKFELTSPNGFTREQLVNDISNKYHEIYKEEEATAVVKTVPADQRTTTYNRNQTNGKYGIWGHDLADLALDHILVYQALNGNIILSLDIGS